MLEYATGVLNVLEKNIFDKQDLERMITASSKEEAFKVLFDTDLGETASKESRLEVIFEKDLEDLRKILFKMLRDTNVELFYFLFLRFDALDIKVGLKENKEPVVTNEYALKLSELSSLEQGSIDERVDRAYLKTKLLLAQKIKGLALDITRFQIDIANLKNAIKQKDIYLKGGNLSYQEVKKVLAGKIGMVSKGLERFYQAFELSSLIEKFERDKSETDLEKGLEKFLSNRILQKEREGGGIEKVIGFFTRKINAHTIIRLIFFQKDSGIKNIENSLLAI
jgi:vacuolar-type H+-ATPase subunit C/Vma6